MDKSLQQLVNSPYFETIGPRVVSVLLVAAIAVSAANLTWLIVTPNTPTTAPMPIVSQSRTNQRSSQAYATANSIARLNLFGEPDTSNRTAVVDAPETQLNLTLTGILSIGDVDGIAIISQGSGQEEIYKVGDNVPGNATVKEVYADRVLLESSRGLEVLTLPRERADLVLSQSDNQSAGFDVAPSQSDLGSALRELRDEFAANPSAMSRMARVLPERDPSGNGMIGLRVEPLGVNEDFDRLFSQLELQSGDVLTRLNGFDLTTPSASLAAMRELMKADALDITVLRNGTPVNITHSDL